VSSGKCSDSAAIWRSCCCVPQNRKSAHVVEKSQRPYNFCADEGGEPTDEEHCVEQAYDCQTNYTLGDYFFDVKGRFLFYVARGLIDRVPETRAEEHPEAQLDLEPTGVRLKGGGCDELVPFGGR